MHFYNSKWGKNKMRIELISSFWLYSSNRMELKIERVELSDSRYDAELLLLLYVRIQPCIKHVYLLSNIFIQLIFEMNKKMRSRAHTTLYLPFYYLQHDALNRFHKCDRLFSFFIHNKSFCSLFSSSQSHSLLSLSSNCAIIFMLHL